MKTPLAKGRKIFRASYHFPAPAKAEIVDCQIDGLSLYPVLLNKKEALVYGCFDLLLCYSCSDDNGEKLYQVLIKKVSWQERVPLGWEEEKSANITNSKVEITSPGPWQCRGEGPGKEKAPAEGLVGLIGAFLNPPSPNFTLHVMGPIPLKVFPRLQALPEEPTPPQKATRAEEQHPAPAGQYMSDVPPQIAEINPAETLAKPLPQQYRRGVEGFSAAERKGWRKTPYPFTYHSHSSATKRVDAIPAAAPTRSKMRETLLPSSPFSPASADGGRGKGKKPVATHSPVSGKYVNMGRKKTPTVFQPWPGFFTMHPPPSKPEGR